MIEVIELVQFSDWLEGLKDTQAAARIVARILRLRHGNSGDYKSVGDGVFELRFTFGPGYRVYFANHEGELVILLSGGDKGSQQRDITKAKTLFLHWKAQQNVGN